MTAPVKLASSLTWSSDRPQRPPQLRLFEELTADNFAAGGGSSTGIEAATGRPVTFAINHDQKALDMHKANHPDTTHLCESIWKVDPAKLANGRRFGLAWFSPDCCHFSNAKGSKPVKKEIRGLAWVMVRWCKRVRPRVCFLENVQEFQTWGPVHPESEGTCSHCGLAFDGRPCKPRKGQTFERWKAHLVRLGYTVEHRTLMAADYGAPTIRKRFFLIARCDGQPIVWPEATHTKEQHRPASEIIDWSLPTRSIFGRTRPLAENTMRRVAEGVQRFVIDAKQPFIVRHGHYARGGAGDVPGAGAGTWRGQPLTQPLSTVCATNDRHLVDPLLRQAGTDDDPQPLHQVAAFVAKHNGGAIGAIGAPLTDPMHTVTAKNSKALVTAFLLRFNSSQRQLADVQKPLGAVTGKPRFGLVTIEGTDYEITDIRMRMLEPRELYNAQGFPADYDIEATSVRGKPLSKTDQHRCVGNSVPPNVAQALVAANYKQV